MHGARRMHVLVDAFFHRPGEIHDVCCFACATAAWRLAFFYPYSVRFSLSYIDVDLFGHIHSAILTSHWTLFPIKSFIIAVLFFIRYFRSLSQPIFFLFCFVCMYLWIHIITPLCVYVWVRTDKCEWYICILFKANEYFLISLFVIADVETVCWCFSVCLWIHNCNRYFQWFLPVPWLIRCVWRFQWKLLRAYFAHNK